MAHHKTHVPSEVNKHHDFMRVDDPKGDCAKQHGVRKVPGIAIFRNFDESPRHFHDDLDDLDEHNSEDKLTSFIKSTSLPEIFHYEGRYHNTIADTKLPVMVLFSNKDLSLGR
jgi:hypothetical protein